MFGKKKEKTPKEVKPKKKSPKRQKGSLLKAIGIDAEAAPTQDDVQRAERHKKIEQAWDFLRTRLDRCVASYYETGSFEELSQFVERPALDSMKQQLIDMRSKGLYWQMPERKVMTQAKYEVVSEELNKRGQPTQFVIEEHFRDHSEILQITDQGLVPISKSDGVDRVIQATVNVRNGQEFKLHSVIAVLDKTI
jgi:hypothetical protein